MSCCWQNVHEQGLCHCFKPHDYLALESEQMWFALLIHVARHRVTHPKAVDSEMLSVMLQERGRWRRN